MAVGLVDWFRGARQGQRQPRRAWYDMRVGGQALQRSTVADLLNALRERLGYGDPAAAKLVEELASAVEGGGQAAHWAGLDLFAVFDVEALVEAMGRRARLRWASAVEFARNVLVLLPIVVTWAVVSFAVAAYQHEITLDRARSTFPFLYLWQTRFNGQSLPTFNELALTDAVLVGTLVLLTAVHRWLTLSAGVEGEDRALVRHALTGATLALADHRADREPVLRSLVEQTEGLRHDLLEAWRQVQAERAALGAELVGVVKGLGQTAAEMRQWSEGLRATHDRVSRTFDETVRRTEAIAERQEAMEGRLEQAGARLGETAARHEEATLGATAAAAGLRATSERLDAAASGLARESDRLAGRAGELDAAAARAASAGEAASEAARAAGASAASAADAAGRAAEAAQRMEARARPTAGWRPVEAAPGERPFSAGDERRPPPREAPPGGPVRSPYEAPAGGGPARSPHEAPPGGGRVVDGGQSWLGRLWRRLNR